MNGLIIKSPYIDDILKGVKKWEVRGMKTQIRGTIVLLQSGTGYALGTVDIVDCIELSIDDYNNWDYRKAQEKVNKLPYRKTYAYVLSNPKIYKNPKKYYHPKGAITWVKLSEDYLYG